MQGLTATQTSLPVQWRFPARWRVLPGVAHGVPQPVILGEWHCKFSSTQDYTPLNQAMASQIPQALPVGIAQLHDGASLLQRMLFRVCAALLSPIAGLMRV